MARKRDREFPLPQKIFPLSPAAIQYALRQIAQRIGVPTLQSLSDIGGSFAGIPLWYTAPDLPGAGAPGIFICPCNPNAAQSLLQQPHQSLTWLNVAKLLPAGAHPPLPDQLPVLFWGAGYEEGKHPVVEQREDGSVIFYVDILATTFFMLSRWEEMIASSRDEHKRFPATASVAYRQNFIDRPIVDEYAMVLGCWLKVLAPDWTPAPPAFAVHLSHDIDHVQSASPRKFAGDLLKRKDLRKACQTLENFLLPGGDPYLQNIEQLATLSEKYGFKSSFYFMAAKHNAYNDGYRLGSRRVLQMINQLVERGHEVGFHAGYETYNQPERFMAEKEHLEQILGITKYGGRQHYLRFKVPDTWRLWEQAGLKYDSSLGYGEQEGFRCGTCHPFRPFDLEQQRELDLLEIPLIVMDVTLQKYCQLSPEEAQDRILQLAQRCKNVRGIFTLLWHNTFSYDHKSWGEMYERLLPRLAELVGTE